MEDKGYHEDFNWFSDSNIKRRIESWIKLAHVCQRWRRVISLSPHRLNLQLVCTPKTPARDTLDVLPPFPLIICAITRDVLFPSRVGNIIAALEHNDRVCQIRLDFYSGYPISYFKNVTNSAAMEKPFPEPTHLELRLFLYGLESILPNSFLGGTTPRLRKLLLKNVPYPGLPKLLLSTTHLIYLSLDDIPRSGYIPPEAMTTSLSVLTNLESLHLRFRYPPPRPGSSRRLPPLARSILPRLTEIQFKGASEYLEEILARIDAPRLNKLYIAFFNQIIFHTPQLFQFISRRPTLRASKSCSVTFSSTPLLSSSRYLFSKYSGWKSNVRSQTSSFHPLVRSAPRPCLPFPHWKAST